MRFVIRPGSDPIARADPTMLVAMGLPGGGLARVGTTHVLIRPGDVPDPSALLLGERSAANAGVAAGQSVEVTRAMLPPARRVMLDTAPEGLDARHLARALQGIPVTTGDTIRIDSSYGNGDRRPLDVKVVGVEPGPGGLIGNATNVTVGAVAAHPGAAAPVASTGAGGPAGRAAGRGESPTTAEALLAGLDAELEALTGWLTLLTSAADLRTAWGLPRVAGVILEGPVGCGKSELVNAAAVAAGATVREVTLDMVFKPERLLDLLERAVKETAPPAVLFIDRLDTVAGDEGLFKPQVGAILRWFLDAVADRPRTACVLGVGSIGRVGDLADSPLLPRRLTIPPPDLRRRRLLFEAALQKVPAEAVDFDLLAARSAGFSGANVLAAVVHASAMVAPTGGTVTTDTLVRAVEETTPSLGSIPLGDMPSYGFERVADLTEVKQRLTEAVIWPVTDPDRFVRLGIEPPRGILLYGPPGTGKTFVVRALAHESGAAFFGVKGAELLDKFVGESERGVREIFARARAAAPSILFFDEIDALAPVRGRSTTTVTDSVVAALLTEIDGIAARGSVAVIGATNRMDLIDPALLRAGRLEVHIELGLPDVEARRALLAISDIPFGPDVDLDRLARDTDGLSFADITGMLREAALEVLRRDSQALRVGWEDVERALTRFRATR